MTSKAMCFWSWRRGVRLQFIQPDQPTQNVFAESFNGRFRDSCLNRQRFRGLDDARSIIVERRHHCNTERPQFTG